MKNNSILTVILAAGKGTRMKSSCAKVMMKAADRPMLAYALDLADALGNKTVVVTGHDAEAMETHFAGRASFCRQKEQLGTADAVLAAKEHIAAHMGRVLILNGDMPLLRYETVLAFIAEAKTELSFISVKMAKPFGYGRVLRTADKVRIIEEKDATAAEKEINEINTGVWLADSPILLERLSQVNTNNAQGEYYLTDIASAGAGVWCAPDAAEFDGANDRVQLAEISNKIWLERAKKHMLNGVSIIAPDRAYISLETEIAPDAVIYPDVYLEGKCTIGEAVTLRHGVRVLDSEIQAGTTVKENTLIEQSRIGKKCSLGPMAHLRPGSVLEDGVGIGNFVELKKAYLKRGAKAGHLTYLGDCEIGEETNIGCGTITCNYDGFNKFFTKIGAHVFVGSDSQFIAPVTVGDGAIIAAGTTVTADIPADALAIARVKQQNKAEMAKIIRGRKGKK